MALIIGSSTIERTLEKLMASQTQLAAQIQGVVTQLTATRADITSKITDLQTQLANAQVVSPEVTAAMAALQATADDLGKVAAQVAP